MQENSYSWGRHLGYRAGIDGFKPPLLLSKRSRMRTGRDTVEATDGRSKLQDEKGRWKRAHTAKGAPVWGHRKCHLHMQQSALPKYRFRFLGPMKIKHYWLEWGFLPNYQALLSFWGFTTLHTGANIMLPWWKETQKTRELMGRNSRPLWWSCLDTSWGNYVTYKTSSNPPCKAQMEFSSTGADAIKK